MKYLEKYKIFESYLKSRNIPPSFISFDSIGRVFDPYTGYLYCKLKDGGYEHENPEEYTDFDDHLSPEYLSIIKSHLTNSKPLIDYNEDLIQSAKDLSLEYTDDGYTLLISLDLMRDDNYGFDTGVTVNPPEFKLRIAEILFNNSIDDEKWLDLSPYYVESIKSCNSIRYCISILKDSKYTSLNKSKHSSYTHGEYSKELIGVLRNMYPTENIRNHYTW